MKTNHCILVILLFSAHCTFSQHALQLGLGYQLVDDGNRTTQQFKADVPSYFKFRSAHKYIEAGLSDFSISSHSVSGAFPIKNAAVSVIPFYEFGRILGDAEPNLRFRIGGRILFENRFVRSAGGGSDYKYTSFDTGFTFAINPGVQYKLGERVSIDFGIPLRLISLTSHFYKHQGPQLSGIMKNDGVEGVLLPKIYQFKVGIIYRLGQ